MSQNSSVAEVGILLPELEPASRGDSLEGLMKRIINSDCVSREARDLLRSASPSRSRSDGNTKQLILIEGDALKKDPHTEEIRRFAKGEGWTTPSFEDALRLLFVVSFYSFSPCVKNIVVLHEPIRESVLGITNNAGAIILTAHKAEPRKGWYCKNRGFIFRSS
jgi:hypothetical protein